MNIRIRVGRLSGGAPLSALQYAKALKKVKGFVITAEGVKHHEHIAELYNEQGISITYIDNLDRLISKKKILGILKHLYSSYKAILDEDIDLIITVGNGNLIYFLSNLCKCLNIHFLGVVAGGDVRIVKNASHWNAKKIVCFSEENKQDIVKEGFSNNKIEVISNRISTEQDINYINHYQKMKYEKEIYFLIASRLDSGKTQSIKSSIALVKWLNKSNINAVLKIAGDGDMFEEIKDLCEKTNRELCKRAVIMLGHVDNIKNEFLDAHIVLGKGRSVLEPIMMKRIGIVVGEDGEFSLCNRESFQNLYYYNFSGRQIAHKTTKEQIRSIIYSLQKGSFNIEGFFESFEKALKTSYHTDYLENKITTLIEKEYSKQRKVKKGRDFHKIFLLYILIKFLLVNGTVRLNEKVKYMWKLRSN